jgi:Ca2+-transporting ATPase
MTETTQELLEQEKIWHTVSVEQAAVGMAVDLELGLSEAEVERRRSIYGPNELEEKGRKNPWLILWEQFTGALVLILIAAAVVSVAIGEYEDAVVVMIIVILNAALGFSQEYRAEQAMAALKKMAAPHVKVRREGTVREILADEVVPGDVVLLEAGDSVPADGRLTLVANLKVQEASLTGESLPVEKSVEPIPDPELPLGDRTDMVYMGTAITYGRGEALIVHTGMETQLGHIAEMIQGVESEKTPLQKRMAQLGRSLAIAAVAIVGVVFVVGLIQGVDPLEMFFTGIALAVAAVPEGLPAVVTIALALGAQRMLRRKALIRKLPAVETLGSVTVICSDKTGTLTENRMTVQILDLAEQTIHVEPTMRRRMPTVTLDEPLPLPEEAAPVMLLASGALCNDAVLQEDPETAGDFNTVGDPTEGALLVAAANYGLWKSELETRFPRVAEIPFSSERKMMTTVHDTRSEAGHPIDPALRAVLEERDAPYVAVTKGAVDGLLETSSAVWVEGDLSPMSVEWGARIEKANNRMAQDGLRVLGIAFKALDQEPTKEELEELEGDLVFLGMVGMMDPPRPEVLEAVDKCKTAGIRVVMITGDHPLTAQRIAEDLGIAEDCCALTGVELNAMDAADLEEQVEDTQVYARVSPEHKLRIVESLQNRGEIASMTGDGVNDAPALRKSDIGVAMGITGTDVSKEASDMVILDDNFATIVSAVEEGRTIYDNVLKFIKYTLTSNVGEILVMLVAPFLGMPIPLTALQILWINLVTDGLPGLALSVEQPEEKVMERPPYDPGGSIFARGMGTQIIWVGLLMAGVSLAVGYWAWSQGNPAWQTMIFTTLTLSQMGNALALRSNRESLFKIGILSNRYMLGAVLLTFVLQLLITYVPFLQEIFGTMALSPTELAVSLAASTVVFIAIEIFKWGVRLNSRRGVMVEAAV